MRTDQGAGTLADRLRSGPLSRSELEQLARDLLGMLSSLHAEGTLHGHLTPATVRLDGAGRLHSSKIGPQRGSAATAGPTAPPSYLAPEIRAGGAADVAADLFACGALLADAAGPDAPAPVLVLIGMLTAEEPDLRPATAAEALALLGGAAPPPAPPAPRAPTAGYRATFEKPVPPPAPAPAAAEVPTEAIQFPPLTAHAAVVDTPPLAPASTGPASPGYPPAPALPPRRRRFGRRALLATAGGLLGLAVVLGGVIALAGPGTSGGTEIPPPAAAPLEQQLDDLDGVIDSLGG